MKPLLYSSIIYTLMFGLGSSALQLPDERGTVETIWDYFRKMATTTTLKPPTSTIKDSIIPVDYTAVDDEDDAAAASVDLWPDSGIQNDWWSWWHLNHHPDFPFPCGIHSKTTTTTTTEMSLHAINYPNDGYVGILKPRILLSPVPNIDGIGDPCRAPYIVMKSHQRCAWNLSLISRIVIIPNDSCWIMLNFKKIFKKAFLPNGYPNSVSQDYFQYQCWDSLQAFASSIMNYLATRAIFQGVGVGDANATVLAATMTWILKDGTSIIGSLLFATVQSTRMDSDCKRWRLFADIINDIAIFVDLLSPLCLKSIFIWIQCLSSVLRSLVGIAGGATRAALTQHQAKCNNMADVSAKDQSQERIVNLLALIFSLMIIPLISEHSVFIWIMFSFFTTLHIYANYRAVKSVQIEIFNAKRLAIFLENYFNNDYANLSVESVNKQENVLFFLRRKHDKTFEQVRFYRKPCDLDRKTCYATDRYVILIDEEYPKFKIFIPEPSPMLMIETLCLIYRYQMLLEQNRETKPTVAFSSHDEDFTKIAILMHQNGWDVKSHVLMAELFHDEDDDPYQVDAAKKSN